MSINSLRQQLIYEINEVFPGLTLQYPPHLQGNNPQSLEGELTESRVLSVVFDDIEIASSQGRRGIDLRVLLTAPNGTVHGEGLATTLCPGAPDWNALRTWLWVLHKEIRARFEVDLKNCGFNSTTLPLYSSTNGLTHIDGQVPTERMPDLTKLGLDGASCLIGPAGVDLTFLALRFARDFNPRPVVFVTNENDPQGMASKLSSWKPEEIEHIYMTDFDGSPGANAGDRIKLIENWLNLKKLDPTGAPPPALVIFDGSDFQSLLRGDVLKRLSMNSGFNLMLTVQSPKDATGVDDIWASTSPALQRSVDLGMVITRFGGEIHVCKHRTRGTPFKVMPQVHKTG